MSAHVVLPSTIMYFHKNFPWGSDTVHIRGLIYLYTTKFSDCLQFVSYASKEAEFSGAS